MHPSARVALLALLLVPVAGCVSKANDAPTAPTLSSTATTGAGPALNLTPAPTWTVGQSWVHKWTILGAGDGGADLVILVRTVVAETADGGWTLATDNQTIAAFHGAFIFPTLGHFSRGLEQSVGTSRFPWYHFPLSANAAWSDKVVLWDGSHDVEVPVHGRVTEVTPAGAYRIELRADGHPVAEYDYNPATQWFDEAKFYDDAGNLGLTTQMVETHTGFKGRLYDDTNGALLLNQQDVVVPSAAIAQPDPAKEFTMTGDQNRLLVFLISFAAGGAHDAELFAPDGTRYGAQSLDGVLFPFYNDSRVLVLAGQPGTWRTASAGAGALAAGGFIQAYGLHERAIDL